MFKREGSIRDMNWAVRSVGSLQDDNKTGALLTSVSWTMGEVCIIYGWVDWSSRRWPEGGGEGEGGLCLSIVFLHFTTVVSCMTWKWDELFSNKEMYELNERIRLSLVHLVFERWDDKTAIVREDRDMQFVTGDILVRCRKRNAIIAVGLFENGLALCLIKLATFLHRCCLFVVHHRGS